MSVGTLLFHGSISLTGTQASDYVSRLRFSFNASKKLVKFRFTDSKGADRTKVLQVRHFSPNRHDHQSQDLLVKGAVKNACCKIFGLSSKEFELHRIFLQPVISSVPRKSTYKKAPLEYSHSQLHQNHLLRSPIIKCTAKHHFEETIPTQEQFDRVLHRRAKVRGLVEAQGGINYPHTRRSLSVPPRSSNILEERGALIVPTRFFNDSFHTNCASDYDVQSFGANPPPRSTTERLRHGEMNVRPKIFQKKVLSRRSKNIYREIDG